MHIKYDMPVDSDEIVNRPPSGGRGGGYSGFQVTALIKGFFWVGNFRIRDFWVRQFGKYFLGSFI